MTLVLGTQAAYRALARAFCRAVQEGDKRKVNTIVRRNRKESTSDSICHTHDFYDANEIMAGAYERVFGREPVIGYPVIEGTGDPRDRSRLTWNAAWKFAFEAEFDPERVGHNDWAANRSKIVREA